MIAPLLAAWPALAADLVVAPQGDYTRIQDAVDAALDGDRVLVSPGTWRGQVDFLGKDIAVIAIEGPELTILDGEDADGLAVVRFTSGEPTTARLQGFTVRGGHGEPMIWNLGRGWNGAGVLVVDSGATLVDLIVEDNHARHSGQSVGGGLAVVRGEVVVRDSLFRRNLGYHAGGAIAALGGRVEVVGCRFEANEAGRGGAVAAFDGASLLVQGNRFEANEALYGGALYLAGRASLRSVDDEFMNNDSYFDGGLAFVMDAALQLDGALAQGGVAGRDGGLLRLGPGAEVRVQASALLGGAARAGGAVFARGEGAVFEAEGLLIADARADEGGALWLAEGARASLAQLTLLRPEAERGAVLALYGGDVDIVNVLLVGGAGAEALWRAGGAHAVSHGLAWDFSGAPWSGEALGEADPLLRDPLASPPDVSPGEGSPAVDAGAPGTLDLDGSAADLGATGGSHPWSP